jgi:hypothetical protein
MAQVQKGKLICDTGGRKVFQTGDPEAVIIQYEQDGAAALAAVLSGVLQQHGIRTAFRDPYGTDGLLATNLESVGLRAAVRVRDGEVQVLFQTDTGKTVNRQEAERLPVSPRQLDCMIDDATHAGRVLRARLSLAGLELVEARFRFGKLPDHGCMMDILDPLACSFWDQRADAPATDFLSLADALGGSNR